MSEWKKYKVSELCTDIIDCVNKTAPVTDIATPFKMLRTSDVRDGFINLEGLNCVTEEVFQKWIRRGELRVGDVVFTREAPLGEVGLVREAKNYFLGQRLVLYRANPKVCDNRFLMYWFLNPINKEKLKSRGVGSTVTHLRVPECEQIEITAPDIETQSHIAEILSTYDNLIENNKQQIKLLEEAAQRLYKKWFLDLQFPGCSDRKLVDGLPMGWEKCNLGDLLDVIRGRSYSSKELSESEGVLMVNLSNMRSFGGYNRNQEKHYTGKFTKDQTVKRHDLIMGVTDMTQERRTVGRVALIPNLRSEAMISMDIIKLVPRKGSTLFYYALLEYGGYSEVISRFANGTNVMHLRPDVLKMIEVILPDSELQKRYVDEFATIQKRIDSLQDESLFASEARDRLLPKIMSGEIEL